MSRTPRRLVMHIGPHKTATSYLQQNFHHNRAKLLERGWLYPNTGERVRIAHHDISDLRTTLLSDDPQLVKELRRIGERARERDLNILLSAEGFYQWKPRRYERIRDLLQLHDLHIVFTIRDPLDVFYAQWAQKVKNGWDDALPVVFEKHFTQPLASSLVNPLVKLWPILSLHGVTADILLYDEIVARKLDIFSLFMERALNLTDIVPSSVRLKNQRLPIELTEFIRALTPMAQLERGNDKVTIGQAVDLFLSAGLKQRIIETMQTRAADARMIIEVGRNQRGLPRVERQILDHLGPYLYPPPKTDRLFPNDTASWVHYDSEALRQNPYVRPLLEKALRRTGRDSLWIRGADAGYAAVIAIRRWRKQLMS